MSPPAPTNSRPRQSTPPIQNIPPGLWPSSSTFLVPGPTTDTAHGNTDESRLIAAGNATPDTVQRSVDERTHYAWSCCLC
ncbi:hypothetical protein GQ53DRAFT_16995 [Thozetella sp. PMI_491]|nr:hypothetical protein GQ53DRAFT_16995 [Thozetella sp. PMI_491]